MAEADEGERMTELVKEHRDEHGGEPRRERDRLSHAPIGQDEGGEEERGPDGDRDAADAKSQDDGMLNPIAWRFDHLGSEMVL